MDEQVSLLIDKKLFAYWSDLEIKLSIDSFDTVGFSAPFEPDRQEFRETFRPFSFKPIQVLVAGEPIFTHDGRGRPGLRRHGQARRDHCLRAARCSRRLHGAH